MTPRRTIEQELGSRLPEGVEVRVVQESARDHLPGASHRLAARRSEELSDQELEEVAGGGGTTVDWSGCASCLCSHHC